MKRELTQVIINHNLHFPTVLDQKTGEPFKCYIETIYSEKRVFDGEEGSAEVLESFILSEFPRITKLVYNEIYAFLESDKTFFPHMVGEDGDDIDVSKSFLLNNPFQIKLQADRDGWESEELYDKYND